MSLWGGSWVEGSKGHHSDRPFADGAMSDDGGCGDGRMAVAHATAEWSVWFARLSPCKCQIQSFFNQWWRRLTHTVMMTVMRRQNGNNNDNSEVRWYCKLSCGHIGRVQCSLCKSHQKRIIIDMLALNLQWTLLILAGLLIIQVQNGGKEPGLQQTLMNNPGAVSLRGTH